MIMTKGFLEFILLKKVLNVCKQLIEIHKGMEKECFENFTQDEKIVLRRLLMQMRDNLIIGCDKPKENQEMEDNE